MKVICPTDFSRTSFNAVKWALDFLNSQNEGVLEIIHCLNIRNRSDMLTRFDEILRDRAQSDLTALQDVLMGKVSDNVKFESRIFDVDPKSFLSDYARKVKADLVVMGSNGLSALKDMTFGSVAETVARKSDTPVMIISGSVAFRVPKQLVLAVGAGSLTSEDLFEKISESVPGLAEVHVLHVNEGENKTFPPAKKEAIEHALPDQKLHFHVREEENSISHTINTFSEDMDADMLCLIHRRRGWLGRLFHVSTMKDAIYELHRPLLVLTDG